MFIKCYYLKFAMVDQFLRRKKQQLMKEDRSLKQSLDEKIKNLCEKINKLDNYYTTSSCSGRILLLKDIKEKRDDVILKMWHNELSIVELKKMLENIDYNGIIYFKQDPCILHVAAKSLEDAQKMHDFGKKAGWKRCGIIASEKRFLVELNGTERLEFPIMDKREILVNDNFLNLVVSEANRKLKLSWEKIKKFEIDNKE